MSGNGSSDDVTEAVTRILMSHPAVAAAAVGGTSALTAHIVPDESEAPLLHRACQLEAQGSLDGLSWHEPAGDLLVAQVNRTETAFLFREIFADRVYLRGGIVLPEGAVVVDVGANIGMFTVFAAAESAGARVLAVEPVPELARAVGINAELHSVDATVLNCAAGREAGEMEFTFYPNNSVMSGGYADAGDRDVLRSYLLSSDAAEDGRHLDDMVADRMQVVSRRCPVRTLTDIIESQQLVRVDLLKIDVEKAEADVLAGINGATWDKIQQIAIEVHDLDGRLAEICGLLGRRGFDVVVDRDPRLARTLMANVYGRRSTYGHPPVCRRHQAVRWPTRAALGADLEATLARRLPDLGRPIRYELVPSLDRVPGADDVSLTSRGAATAVLAEIWAEIFGPDAVGDSANFFDLGGDSLTAVRLVARVEDLLGEDALAPDAVFTAASFAELAAILESGA